MKRWMGYLLALVLTAGMILSGASFAEESGAAKTLEVGKSFQYAVAQDRVWVVTQDGVTVYDGSMETQVSSFEIDFQPMRLAAGADGLYLLKGEGSASEVVRMDEKGQVTGQWSLPEGTGCVQMEIAEDEALLLVDPTGRDHSDDVDEDHLSVLKCQLWSLSLAGGGMTQIEGVENLFSISVAGDVIAAYSQDAGEVTLLDRKTRKPQGRCSVIGQAYVTITEEGELFALDGAMENTAISYVNIAEEKLQMIYQVGTWAMGLRTANGYLYCRTMDQNQLLAYPAAEPEATDQVFTIGCLWNQPAGEQFTIALEQLKAEFPDLSVEYKVVDVSEELATSLMAGDLGCDVFYYGNGVDGTGAWEYFRAGAFQDLTGYPRVMAAYEETPDVKNLFSCDGGVFGVPMNESIMFHAFQVNQALFDQYGLEVPSDDWTWEDFFALADRVQQLQQQGEDVYLLQDEYNPCYLNQYNLNCMAENRFDYTDEAYRTNLEKWVQAENAGVIRLIPEDYDYEQPLGENALFVYVTYINYAYATSEGVYFINLPRLTENTKNIADTWMMVIPAGAKNPEAAEAFLAAMLSKEAMCSYVSVQTIGPLYQDLDVSGIDPRNLAELNLDETNIQRWRNWMANSVNPPEKSFMWEQMTDWYPQLCSGEMTIDQFLFQTQERADMVLGE